MSKIFDWTLRYGLPYGSSTLAAYISAGLVEPIFDTYSAAGFIWLAENVTFYVFAYCCDQFAPEDQRLFNDGEESRKQLIVTELIDIFARFLLFLLVPALFPGHPDVAAGAASLAADIIFLLALKRSRRLVELINALIREKNELPSFNPLGLTGE